MLRILLLFFVLSCLSGVIGCDNDCVSGRVESCPCDDGTLGAQTCAPEGTFGPCLCPGIAMDGGLLDGAPADAGAVDAGPSPTDAGPTDAGPTDAGPTDAGPTDAGPTDAGPMDAGPVDAGPVDAGPVDAGTGPITDCDPASIAAARAAGLVLEGDFLASNSADLMVLDRYAVVTGALEIRPGGSLVDISLPNLVCVEHLNAMHTSTAIRTLSLPNLRSVNTVGISTAEAGSLDMRNLRSSGPFEALGFASVDLSSLETVSRWGRRAGELRVAPAGPLDLPSLRMAEGLATGGRITRLNINPAAVFDDLRVGNGTVLSTLTLPPLTTYRSVAIDGNTALTTLDLSIVTAVDALQVTNNGVTTIDLSSLATARDIEISDNAALTSIVFSSLVTVLGTDAQIRLWDNDALPRVDFPVLTDAWTLDFQSNDSLAALTAPMLTTLRGYCFHANPLPPRHIMRVIGSTGAVDTCP